MSNKENSIEWLRKELLNSEPNILEWNKLFEQAKEMHKQEEYETKAFWFGRGILAHTKNRINELKPIRNNEQ
jgi:hypothetical protein